MAHGGQQVERGKHGKLKTTSEQFGNWKLEKGKLKNTSEQAKKSQTNKVEHRSKWWLIETTNNEEG